ncbi:MAG: DUF5916 domain-containing protein [Bacteroidia bacterium]|nr:DUF5916 domain-containing protein [Bacteroidia bacterium]
MKSLLTLLLGFPFFVFAQNAPGTALHIKKAKGEIVLDGVLDEPDWQQAQPADKWFLNYPVDTLPPPFNTFTKLTFNEEFLYVAFVCEDDTTPDMLNSLRRDFDYDLNDNVGLVIGPYNDRLNGFFFTITPKGVQMEGTVSSGGSNDGAWGISWDNKWYSKVVRYPDKWIVEMAIPFKSFRYKSDISEWNIVLDRQDRKRNYKSSWIRTPIQFSTGALAFSGQLIWDDPIPPAHTNISLIPYVAGGISDLPSTPGSKPDANINAGFDAKIGIGPSVNLDLTINPDFSQVEVDQQVINLTRFEVQFPERRQFFLENSDLLDQIGFPSARPFFSRRIGLAADTSGLFKKIPIIYGARLSGSFNEKWRVSMLNMQTKEDLTIGLPGQNYTVATVQRNFWAQSNFTVSLVNKQSLGVADDDTARFFHQSIFQEIQTGGQTHRVKNTYNRVVSADLEMLSKNNKWYHSSYIGKSFDDIYNSQSLSGAAFFSYSSRNLEVFIGNTFVEENFNAEAGFVPSADIYPGYFSYFSGVNYKFYPKSEAIVSMGPALDANLAHIPNGTVTDQSYSLGYQFDFINTSQLELNYSNIFQELTFEFNPIGQPQYTTFKVGERYQWSSVSAEFQSNTRRLFNFNLSSTYGGFYNGQNFNLSGQMSIRYQPYLSISLRFDYNDLKLPENYGQEKLFLIGPRIDLTLSDAVFLTTFFQYNSLLNNMNLNARFQWRYSPASDFFIVYTENYLPQNFASKNRALVFKLTYWLNL